MRGQKEASGLREKFGARVRFLRSERNYTQEQLSERAGISVDFLSLIERGKSAPSFENLEELAQALDVSVPELFSFGGESSEAE